MGDIENLDEILKKSIETKKESLENPEPEKIDRKTIILAQGISKLATSINILLKGKWKMTEAELEVFQQAIEEICIEHNIMEIKAEWRLALLGGEYLITRITLQDIKSMGKKKNQKDVKGNSKK